MAVIPSFGSYAPAPDLAGAYLGAQRIRQQAAEAAARIQLGREQLAQEAVQNQMELAAKKEILASEALRRAQEQEIEKAYRQTQIGLKERELATQEEVAAARIKEASEGFLRNQEYSSIFRARKAAGATDSDAAIAATLATGGSGRATAIQASRSGGAQEDREAASIRGKKLSSDLGLLDRAMGEQRKALLDAGKITDKNKRYSAELKANSNLMELQRQRDLLFQNQSAPSVSSGGLSAPTTTATPVAAPSLQRPTTSRLFIGTPGGVDASGFPQAEPTRPPTITTQADYDALQSGQQYINSAGKLAFKPYKL